MKKEENKPTKPIELNPCVRCSSAPRPVTGLDGKHLVGCSGCFQVGPAYDSNEVAADEWNRSNPIPAPVAVAVGLLQHVKFHDRVKCSACGGLGVYDLTTKMLCLKCWQKESDLIHTAPAAMLSQAEVVDHYNILKIMNSLPDFSLKSFASGQSEDYELARFIFTREAELKAEFEKEALQLKNDIVSMDHFIDEKHNELTASRLEAEGHAKHIVELVEEAKAYRLDIERKDAALEVLKEWIESDDIESKECVCYANPEGHCPRCSMFAKRISLISAALSPVPAAQPDSTAIKPEVKEKP